MGLDCLKKFKTGKMEASQNFRARVGPGDCPAQSSLVVFESLVPERRESAHLDPQPTGGGL